MTLEEAEQLCADNGCRIYASGLTGNRFTIERTPDNYHYINKDELKACSKEKFLYFYILEPR